MSNVILTYSNNNTLDFVTNNYPLGSENIFNGGFSASTGWAAASSGGSGWTISGGFAVATNAAVNAAPLINTLGQTISAISGRTYNIEFDVSITSGTMGWQYGGSSPAVQGFQGHNRFTYVAVSSGAFYMYGFNAPFNGTVTNISIKEITGSTFSPSITKTGNAGSWEFGDLSGGTSAFTNSPSYTYTMNGNKNVRLTVDNPSQVTRINLASTNIVGTLDTRNFNQVTIFSATSNSNLTQIINPLSNAQYSFYYAFSNNLTGNLDLSPLSSLGGEFQVFLNPNLTSITNPVSSKIFTYYYAHTCNLTSNLNMSGLTGLGGSVQLQSNPLLTGVTLPNTSQSIVSFSVFSCNITGNINLSGLTGLSTRLLVASNSLLTNVTLPTNNQTMATFSAQSCTLSGINFTAMTAFTSVNTCNIALQDNVMTSGTVNTMLVDLNTISSPELIGYWKLDSDASEPINNNSGVTTDVIFSGSGFIGGSAIFSGTTSRIVIASATTLNVPSNKLSVCGWIYPTNNSVFQAIVARRDGTTTAGWEIANSTGTLRVVLRGALVDVGGGALILNTWQFIAFTYDGTNLKLFLNGTQTSNGSGTATINNSRGITIGCRDTGTPTPAYSEFFTGQTDNIMYFNRDLTQAEITQIYNSSSGTTSPLFSGRTINIAGTNAAPTGAGLTAKISLSGKGFTIVTN